MRARRQPVLEVLSISALDLFASALGSFMLLAVAMFPFYLKQPALKDQLLGAGADLSRARAQLNAAQASEVAARQAETRSEDQLAAAQARFDRADATADTLDQSLKAPPPSHLMIADLDLVFVMDTTGSMRRELADIQANLIGIIRVLGRLSPSLRVGFVAYKDFGEDYVTRAFDLSAMTPLNQQAIIRFVGAEKAKGGGDTPEPVDAALGVAVSMPWRHTADGRIIVVGDAPARRQDMGRALALAKAFRDTPPDAGRTRNVSTILTGDDPITRSFFNRLAQAGGGVFYRHQGQLIESVLLTVLPGGDPGNRE